MLDMLGHVSQPFNTQPAGGLTLYPPAAGGGYGAGGVWVPGAAPSPIVITECNIQPATKKTIEFMEQLGGTANPRDIRNIYINDGVTYVYPEDEGRPADRFQFSDGLTMRVWRVMHVDNRPWHNYCHVIVERLRESAAAPPIDTQTILTDAGGLVLIDASGNTLNIEAA
jgi:hypothetical protein